MTKLMSRIVTTTMPLPGGIEVEKVKWIECSTCWVRVHSWTELKEEK